MDLDRSGGGGEHTQPQTTLHTHEGAIVEHLDKKGGREEREEGNRWRRGKGGGWKGGGWKGEDGRRRKGREEGRRRKKKRERSS